MSDGLKCEIIKDLLPSYIEKLTSDVTNEAVESHIKECKECKQLLEDMKQDELKSDEEDQREINYLKKVKHRTWYIAGIGVLITAVVIVCFFVWRVFEHGFAVSPSSIQYNVNLEDDILTFSGELLESSMAYTHTTFNEQDGAVRISVYEAPSSILNNSNQFTESYRLKGNVDIIYFEDLIVYKDQPISKPVAEVYKTKHKYIGDMPANSRVAGALGVYEELGNFSNSLQTTAEPYGWTLEFQITVEASEEKTFNEKMKAYACVMLAMIDNLNTVSWTYECNGITVTQNLTTKEASEYAGQNVKEASKDIAQLQEMMKELNLFRLNYPI
jgi:predicted anti-sigma-YlaC factor YlaD